MSVIHRAARLAFPFAMTAVACACSSASKPSNAPVIDSLQVPSTFSVAGNQYTLQGTITFHDTGSTVTGLHEKIPTYNLDQTISVSSLGSQGTAMIELGFQSPSTIASGTQVEIDVSLVNADGVESDVQTEHASVP